MLAVMRDPNADPHDRLEMAKAAAPYLHPRLAAVAHIDDRKPRPFDRIEVVIVEPPNRENSPVPIPQAAKGAGSTKPN